MGKVVQDEGQATQPIGAALALTPMQRATTGIQMHVFRRRPSLRRRFKAP